MSKQSAITRSKSSKETQEEAVKQAQSQQYWHQSDILDITLLPPSSTLYLIHTLLQSPHFDSKQTNADILVIFLSLEFKQNLRILTVKWISHILIWLSWNVKNFSQYFIAKSKCGRYPKKYLVINFLIKLD